MELVRTVEELRAISDRARAAGRRVALVPTMGALHDGHLALVAAARGRADVVVVSIFVNPTQFGPSEDLASYPRTLDADLARCEHAGVDVVFAPAAVELYPEGAQTFVEVAELARPLCGASRPHFFRGVATVVAKLLVAARPHLAVFGEKDFQQLQVVRRLARDLLLDVEIVGAPIVRERDGLAMSSRNVYLDAPMRAEALALVQALDAAEAAVAAGERSAAVLLEQVRKQIGRAPHAQLDYAELRDPETLADVATLTGPTLLALAVRFPAPGLMKQEGSAVMKQEGSAVMKQEGSAVMKQEGSAVMKQEGSAVMKQEGSAAASGEVRLIDNRVLLQRHNAEDHPR